MGFEPLPFDPIKPCTCHQRCPNFKKVAARYWVKVPTGGDRPRLDSGVLVEFEDASGQEIACFWRPVIPFLFPSVFFYEKRHFPEGSPFAIQWEVHFDVLLTPLAYLATNTDPPESCSYETLVLPKLSGPATWGNATAFRVEWWENANDVPH